MKPFPSGFFLIAFAFTTASALSCIFPQWATQCTSFSVSFSGESATPFTLLLLPASSDSPQVISIPDDSWNATSSQGFFSTPISFADGTEFIAVLQDGQGRGTGIVSQQYNVSSSQNSTCLSPPHPFSNTFSFSPSSPSQCGIQTVSWNVTGQGPNSQGGDFLNNLNITSFIPQGQPFMLNAVDSLGSSNEAIWQVNVPAGQQFLSLLEYMDSNGNIIRETSGMQAVLDPASGTVNCLGPTSPRVTVEALEGVATATSATSAITRTSPLSTPTSSISSADDSASLSPLKTLIEGSVLGGIVLTAILLGILLWCRRRRRRSRLKSENEAKLKEMLPSLEEGKTKTLFIDSTAPLGIAFPPSIAPSSRSATPSSLDRLGELPTKRFMPRPFKPSSRKDTSSMMSWGNRGPLPPSTRTSMVDRGLPV